MEMASSRAPAKVSWPSLIYHGYQSADTSKCDHLEQFICSQVHVNLETRVTFESGEEGRDDALQDIGLQYPF